MHYAHIQKSTLQAGIGPASQTTLKKTENQSTTSSESCSAVLFVSTRKGSTTLIT